MSKLGNEDIKSRINIANQSVDALFKKYSVEKNSNEIINEFRVIINTAFENVTDTKERKSIYYAFSLKYHPDRPNISKALYTKLFQVLTRIYTPPTLKELIKEKSPAEIKVIIQEICSDLLNKHPNIFAITACIIFLEAFPFAFSGVALVGINKITNTLFNLEDFLLNKITNNAWQEAINAHYRERLEKMAQDQEIAIEDIQENTIQDIIKDLQDNDPLSNSPFKYLNLYILFLKEFLFKKNANQSLALKLALSPIYILTAILALIIAITKAIIYLVAAILAFTFALTILVTGLGFALSAIFITNKIYGKKEENYMDKYFSDNNQSTMRKPENVNNQQQSPEPKKSSITPNCSKSSALD